MLQISTDPTTSQKIFALSPRSMNGLTEHLREGSLTC